MQSVPFKNTVVGKTVRTFFQSTAGILVLVLPTLLANQQFRDIITAHPSWSWVFAAFPVASAVFTAIQNAVDPTVPLTVKSVR